MIVDRVKQRNLMNVVLKDPKAREAGLEEVVHRVAVVSKETQAAMVSQAEMAYLAFQDLKAFLVQTDSLDDVEDLERTACLVYQGPRAHLVIRAEMVHEARRVYLALKEHQAPLVDLGQMVYQPHQDELACLVILELLAYLEDLDLLELRVIQADLELRVGKETRENQGLDSKDCQVMLVTEEFLDVQVRNVNWYRLCRHLNRITVSVQLLC